MASDELDLETMEEVEADLDENMPYWRAAELVRESFRLREKGERDAAFLKLLEAVHSSIESGTQYIDDLRERVAELESTLSSVGG